MPERQGTGDGLVLRVCALYPDLMNIYADRGNLIVLERRCAWRGIGFELAASSLGEPLDADGHDLFYIGGGQDRDQRLCAEDLLEHKAQALRAAAAREAVVLGVCGGYQLLGSSYTLGDERIEGVGLLDVQTVRGDGPRLIGNVAIEPIGPRPTRRPGRCSRGSRTTAGAPTLGPAQQPLGRVLRGHGNDGRSGYEGARSGNTIGTYLHGPLLPKNAWFADWLIATRAGDGRRRARAARRRDRGAGRTRARCRPPACESAGRSGAVAERGRMRDADDHAFRGLQPCDGLPPRLLPGVVEQVEPAAFELPRGGAHRIRARDIELDARLRDRSLGRPLGRGRSTPQRPASAATRRSACSPRSLRCACSRRGLRPPAANRAHRRRARRSRGDRA